ncbi:hypothetical protein PV08_06899 [Exophiala spinifera]|uniref:Uncharacterized protein n=1 Tax=Exophiala spinifera TaxID=91928 RepID=A0A0D2B5E3_9EURO|nr:uncharacterized protein PV08_06899 [Exophiala spinifera]KIW14118.1 hypothetical protein PV08_06899 [Exophiala spinifera]
MHLTSVIASALMVIAQADITSAKAIAHLPNALRRRIYMDDLERDVAKLLRRAPEPQKSGSVINVAAPTNMTNATIATACTDALSKITKVDNPAGFGACYNILSYDAKNKNFEADLRLYQMFNTSGAFAGLQASDLQIGLVYPSSTTFQPLTSLRRTRRSLEGRAANMPEIQQYSLVGNFDSTLDLNKLNDTQIMSLMWPDIKLNAVDADQKIISGNITANDGAWFVTGQFSGEFKPDLVTAAVAKKAISVAKPFVLPGTHWGIFPIGFIVTMVWTVLFFIAYGLGTLGRIRYRDAYRKRKAAQAGRTGKRI